MEGVLLDPRRDKQKAISIQRKTKRNDEETEGNLYSLHEYMHGYMETQSFNPDTRCDATNESNNQIDIWIGDGAIRSASYARDEFNDL